LGQVATTPSGPTTVTATSDGQRRQSNCVGSDAYPFPYSSPVRGMCKALEDFKIGCVEGSVYRSKAYKLFEQSW
jgi:hypothetical protein